MIPAMTPSSRPSRTPPVAGSSTCCAPNPAAPETSATGRRVGKTRRLALAPLPIKRIHDRWIGEYTRAAVDVLARLDD
jgi:hypothetical protein